MSGFGGLLIHHVTILRFVEGTEDRFGNRPLERDPDADVTVPARVDYADTSENITDREEQRADFVVYLPAGTVVAGTDELLWLDRGITLKAAGAPQELFDAIGLHHLELDAYRHHG